MTDSPEIQGMNFEHLYSESMTLVVRAGHPLTQSPLDRSLLENYPLVLPLANTTIRAFADSLFVQCGISQSRQRLETLLISLSRRYVLDNDAVWIAPLDAVRLDLASGELQKSTSASANRVARSVFAATPMCQCRWLHRAVSKCCASWGRPIAKVFIHNHMVMG